ncbi:hypothetical protein BMH32_13295 [Leucobacter sp. OLJS4]|nr:hypothetical protein BMH26_08835 [Leucobacter sp. OLTLW20]PII92691.1 hypothetical protein BMH27_04815 [Leucobacter sp. OLAS13]PII98414.1 hypothetical protein BMH29_07625 [Leucobacter sp. OLDS2]PIJ01274.1 hypothetical protein BMH28_07030 [Leucobacter sp. OLCS4]PIJ05367.1 hypothetical protein BMH31_00840 [Leucobacter sp. OLIS6]PIJ06543.1 hypothetical protein BMH32_13295 [Leucobacter sp. OLJS4]PIJ57166.1 hypothetical protein BV503_02145 [Leucobacter sp. OAMSW11]PIO50684.1 hypothetical protei
MVGVGFAQESEPLAAWAGSAGIPRAPTRIAPTASVASAARVRFETASSTTAPTTSRSAAISRIGPSGRPDPVAASTQSFEFMCGLRGGCVRLR